MNSKNTQVYLEACGFRFIKEARDGDDIYVFAFDPATESTLTFEIPLRKIDIVRQIEASRNEFQKFT